MKKFFLATLALCFLAGCANQTAVVYGGSTRSETDLKGQIRLAQNEVEVVVEGQTETATLQNTGNYFVVWVEDMVNAVRSIKRLRLYRSAIAQKYGDQALSEIDKNVKAQEDVSK